MPQTNMNHSQYSALNREFPIGWGHRKTLEAGGKQGKCRVIDFFIVKDPQKHIFSIHHYHLFATFATSQQSREHI